MFFHMKWFLTIEKRSTSDRQYCDWGKKCDIWNPYFHDTEKCIYTTMRWTQWEAFDSKLQVAYKETGVKLKLSITQTSRTHLDANECLQYSNIQYIFRASASTGPKNPPPMKMVLNAVEQNMSSKVQYRYLYVRKYLLLSLVSFGKSKEWNETILINTQYKSFHFVAYFNHWFLNQNIFFQTQRVVPIL